MFLLTNDVTHFQVLPVPFIEYGQNVNTNDISQMKLFGEEWVADVEWSFKTILNSRSYELAAS